MDVRVSSEVNSILDLAASISIRRGRYYVGVEHVFEALLERKELLPAGVAAKYWLVFQAIMKKVGERAWEGAAPASEVFYTPRCGIVVSEAASLAERLRSPNLGAGHLMLAILSDPDSSPSRAIQTMDVSKDVLLDDLRGALGPESGRKPAAPSQSATVAIESSAKEEESADNEFSLDGLTTDLTAAARNGRLGPAIGRDNEITALVQILTRQTKNNAILVGEPGVGKTKIVEGLAVTLGCNGYQSLFPDASVHELNVGALLAATQYRGALEERIVKLVDKLKHSPGAILFIDEVHLIMGAGATGEGAVDVANLLKPALARGDFRCIGATTFKEYPRFIEKDPAIERRFQMVRVEPLSDEATLQVLLELRPSLSRHHGLRIPRALLPEVISLTKRYIPNRHLPDKAIDALDQACAACRLKMVGGSRLPASTADDAHELTLHEVRKVVSQLTSLPLEELTAAERMRLEDLDSTLRKKIVGQDEAVLKVVSAVRKSRVGLSEPNRPDASFLFAGSTGVGKTQLAKELAAALFGSTSHLIMFDMSEYVEEHSVSRLLGAPPGYAGSDEEGRLSGAVRKAPYSVLLFDEIEKAHPHIMDIFLPILDEGRIKDSRGRDVNFRNCIIIMTSNVGSKILQQENGNGRGRLMSELGRHFRPEFLNRIDDIIPFYPLVSEDIRSILLNQIKELTERLARQKYHLRIFQRVYEHMAREGYSAEFGARELRRTVEQLIVDPISNMIVSGTFQPGDAIDVLMEDGELIYQKGVPRGEYPHQGVRSHGA